ncbi:hypothetical protein D3C87_873900 [compost metagenome]
MNLGDLISSALANPDQRANQDDMTAIRESFQQIGSQYAGFAGFPQSLLPAVVPVVLKVLQDGSGTRPGDRSNPLLGAFRDADRDGEVDFGDAMQPASRFIRPPRF